MPIINSLFRKAKPRWPQPPSDTVLSGVNVNLRTARLSDWREWNALRSTSRDFLVPWEPAWPQNALSYEYFSAMLQRHAREWREGSGYAFFIFLQPDAKGRLFRKAMNVETSSCESAVNNGASSLAGAITLNDVQRGISQKATLGYWIGKPYAGFGLMTEAAGLVCDFAFDTLKLHRVEAGCLPRNEPSKRLLLSLGFEREGHAKSYLRINGEWEDHLLWGKVEKYTS